MSASRSLAGYSPSEARRAAFAERWGLPVVGDIEAIFANRTIDAVMVLTPPSTHLELTRRAVEAGKHVLLEKPVEITVERAEALVEAAEAAGVTLGIVLQHRFRPASMALSGLRGRGPARRFDLRIGAHQKLAPAKLL